jgi:hypothetical protein
MSDDYKFITTTDLLSQIGEGIGLAHENLAKHTISTQEIGMLAVKNAEVTVSFELTSVASSATSTAGVPSPFPLSGAKTFSFTSKDDSTTIINKATVVLNIVNVMPQKTEDDNAKNEDDVKTIPGTGTGIPGTGTGVPGTASGAVKYKDIIAKLEQAAAQLQRLPLSAQDKEKILKKIRTAIELYKQNKESEAKQILKELAAYVKP